MPDLKPISAPEGSCPASAQRRGRSITPVDARLLTNGFRSHCQTASRRRRGHVGGLETSRGRRWSARGVFAGAGTSRLDVRPIRSRRAAHRGGSPAVTPALATRVLGWCRCSAGIAEQQDRFLAGVAGRSTDRHLSPGGAAGSACHWLYWVGDLSGTKVGVGYANGRTGW